MLSDNEEWCYGVADLTLMSDDRTTVMQMIRKSVRDAEAASREAIYGAEAEQLMRPLREENQRLRTILAEAAHGFGRILIATSDDAAVRDWQKRAKAILTPNKS